MVSLKASCQLFGSLWFDLGRYELLSATNYGDRVSES
jgi:hypothetical protein